MNVQWILNIVRPLVTATVALLFLVSVVACSQPSTEIPAGQPTPDTMSELEMSDRATAPPEIIQDKLEDTFETIGNEVEDAAEQVKTVVESAIDTFDDLNESTADVLDEVIANTEQAIQATAKDLKQSIKDQTKVIKKAVKAEKEPEVTDRPSTVSTEISEVSDDEREIVNDAIDTAATTAAVEVSVVSDDEPEVVSNTIEDDMKATDAEFEALYSKVKARESAVEETFDAIEADS